MTNITCFWSFGAILGPFGLFGIISEKTWFFASKRQSAFWPKWFGAKNQVLSGIIPRSPNGSKMAPSDQKHVILTDWDPFGPQWTMDIKKPAMFGHFWPQKGHFGPPCAHDWRMAMAKTASNQLGICLRIMHVQRIPKVSIFMAVTTKIVPEKAQKWPKMARFWPKWRYNGRVMAREVFFHQCLWVTKFCAKFGRSRIPRTARAPNSFIILRCMWKEPAPLGPRLEHPWAIRFFLVW